MSYLKKPEKIYVDDYFPEDNFPHPNEIAVPDSKLIAKKPKLYSPIGDIIEKIKNLPPMVFICPGVAENSFGFVFGPPKSGKTTFVEALFFHIAAGRKKFMNFNLGLTDQKCLFISCEEGVKRPRFERNDIQLKSFTENEILHINQTNNFMVSNEHLPLHMHTDKDWKILENCIAQSGAKIVAIDSLNRLTPDSNADEEGYSKYSIQCKKIRI